MTPEEIKGMKFEIFLEKIFKHTNFQNIMRNVEFHKSRYLYRQVDLIAWQIEKNKITKYAIEAKYTTYAPIKYDLRQKIKRKTESGYEVKLTNIIDQIKERQTFINYDKTILITNGTFENKLIKEATKNNILLMDGQNIKKIYTKLSNRENFEDAIKRTKIKFNDKYKNMIYIR